MDIQFILQGFAFILNLEVPYCQDILRKFIISLKHRSRCWNECSRDFVYAFANRENVVLNDDLFYPGLW